MNCRKQKHLSYRSFNFSELLTMSTEKWDDSVKKCSSIGLFSQSKFPERAFVLTHLDMFQTMALAFTNWKSSVKQLCPKLIPVNKSYCLTVCTGQSDITKNRHKLKTLFRRMACKTIKPGSSSLVAIMIWIWELCNSIWNIRNVHSAAVISDKVWLLPAHSWGVTKIHFKSRHFTKRLSVRISSALITIINQFISFYPFCLCLMTWATLMANLWKYAEKFIWHGSSIKKKTLIKAYCFVYN